MSWAALDNSSGMAPRPLRIIIVGLSITSSWGNGHATTYRGLMRALCRRGHEVLFLECDKPWYRAHRDMASSTFGTVRLYEDLGELRRGWGGGIPGGEPLLVWPRVSGRAPPGRL